MERVSQSTGVRRFYWYTSQIPLVLRCISKLRVAYGMYGTRRIAKAALRAEDGLRTAHRRLGLFRCALLPPIRQVAVAPQLRLRLRLRLQLQPRLQLRPHPAVGAVRLCPA